MNEIEQLTAERDEALASAKRAWDEVGVLNHRCDEYRGRLMQVQPLVDAARAWREARTAFGATRMEREHDVLWAVTEQLEAAVDALAVGSGAPETIGACPRCGGLDGTHTRRGCADGDGEIDESSVNAELAEQRAARGFKHLESVAVAGAVVEWADGGEA